MALTRPTIDMLNTNIEYFVDPITVLHQGSTIANVDVGFIYNRSNGLTSNVASYWSESGQAFVFAFTNNTGVTNTNVSATSYANITAGNLIPGANVTYNLGSPTLRWAELFLSGNTIDLNGATISAINGNMTLTNQQGGSFTVSGSVSGQSTATFGNLVANSGIGSTTTTSGALQVIGGAGITGAVYIGNILNISNAGDVSANIGTLYLGNVSVNANLGTLLTRHNTLDANIGAYELATNANIGTLYLGNVSVNANLGGVYNHVNTLDANIGVLYLGNVSTQANIGSIYNHINTLDANVGAYELATNANIGTLYLGNVGTQANLGAYQTFANTNINLLSANLGTLYLGNVSTQANLGAFETYANTAISSLYTNANANTAAYLSKNSLTIGTTGGNTTVGGNLVINGNVFAQGTLTYVNTEVVNASEYVNTINAVNVYATTIGNTGATITGSTFVVSGTAQGSSLGTGALQVTNGGAYIAGNLYVGGNINLSSTNTTTITGNSGTFFGNAAGFGALYAGVAVGYSVQPQTVIQASTNFNSYAQINHQNVNSGASASTDYVATADTGSATAGYIDMGINSSGFVGGAGNELNYPLDGYLIVQGTTNNNGNLVLSTYGSTDIVLTTNGQGLVNQQARFKNNVGLIIYQTTTSTNTTSGALQVAGGAGIGGALYVSSTVTAATVNAETIGNTGATLTGTLNTAGQSNITRVGTLLGLTVGGATTLANVVTGGITSNGTIIASTVNAGVIGNTGTVLTGTLNTATQTGITTVGTLSGLTVGGATTLANLVAGGITSNGTIIASTVNAGVIGNTGAVLNGTFNGIYGTATGTVPTANTAIYVGITAESTGTWYPTMSGQYLTPGGNVQLGIAQAFTVSASTGNVTAPGFVGTHWGSAGITSGNISGVTTIATTGTITATGNIVAASGTASTSNVTGAIVSTGGVGVAGNVYVGNRVGYVWAANSVSSVYQVFNNTTYSLDTIFG